jgi:hypothetical protein
MKGRKFLPVLFTLVCVFAASESFSQSSPTYIQFSPGEAKGALYKPESAVPAHVGILVMHRTSNVMGSLACTELVKRGFVVLCMNPRFDNNEALVRWETIALDVKSGVTFLRKQPGITKVLLLGGSGGGPTMSFYQAVAEKGPSYCQGPKKLVQCGNELAGLPPADGIIFRDAHPGNPANGLRSINPAIVNENRPHEINPALDPFNPKNGFNPNGPSRYSESFKKNYFRAQAARMNKLIDVALRKVALMESGKYAYPDDDAFLIVGGEGARLMQLDLTIHPGTVNPHKLLKNDGSIVTEVVKSVRLPSPSLAKSSKTFDDGTRFLTVRSFLSANATRATDSMDGIDDCSTNNSTPCALRVISVPVLIGAMGAHYFIRDNEIHYEVAASRDKDLIVIEGANHGITPCTRCEQSPGQYSNSVKNFFDYVAAWINGSFNGTPRFPK